MKGIVYTEFLDMVETQFGLDTVDTIIENSDLPSGGAYTAVATYSHTEIVTLVSNLALETNIEVPVLLKAFGKYLFNSLNKAYPAFGESASDAFNFLEKVETYIHVEVRKLYPDAQLPTFECSRPNNQNELHMIYSSSRHFEDLCEGLIEGCLEAFNSNAKISRQTLSDSRELFIMKQS